MCFTHFKMTKVRVAIWISLKSLTIPEIILPLSLKLPAIFVPHDSLPEPLLVHQLPHVDGVRVLPLDIVWQRLQRLHVKFMRFQDYLIVV